MNKTLVFSLAIGLIAAAALSTAAAPAYDAVCTTGYTAWDGVAEITATTGQTILIDGGEHLAR